MARPGRLELPTLCLEGRRSIQLSYGRYVDSKRFPVSTTILKCHFAVFLQQEVRKLCLRMSRIPFLARLRAPKHSAFEFAFRLEPIVQVKAWLFAAFEINFVCATSDFLVTRGVPH